MQTKENTNKTFKDVDYKMKDVLVAQVKQFLKRSGIGQPDSSD